MAGMHLSSLANFADSVMVLITASRSKYGFNYIVLLHLQCQYKQLDHF